jgi:hypothetical protein
MIELSARQQEIIRLSVKGVRTKFIAKELGLSPETIKSHIRAILKKTKTPRILWWKLNLGEWSPIETISKDWQCVDIWIKSTRNPEYGVRMTDVCFHNGVISGHKGPNTSYGEYASHFMPTPLPPPPKGEA